MLKSLRDNLQRKAKAYETPILASIFLINNYDYILKTLVHCPFADILRDHDREVGWVRGPRARGGLL